MSSNILMAVARNWRYFVRNQFSTEQNGESPCAWTCVIDLLYSMFGVLASISYDFSRILG